MTSLDGSVTSNRGQRLLPSLVDEIALEDPNRVCISYTSLSGPKDGYHDVTFKTLAGAINKCAWWLDEYLGPVDSFETLTYVGPRDLRAMILMFAAIKTGYKVIEVSAQNMSLHAKRS